MKLVKTIDHTWDTRTRIYLQDDGLYALDYEEYYEELGWHHIGQPDGDWSKEAVEWEYDITL